VPTLALHSLGEKAQPFVSILIKSAKHLTTTKSQHRGPIRGLKDYLSRRTPKGAYSFGLALFATLCYGLVIRRFGTRVGVAVLFSSSGLRRAPALGHSQTAEAASFQRALFTLGADKFLGPPHAPAAQMRLRASRRAPPKPTRQRTRLSRLSRTSM
jgi:hypothetical protein